jgi:hypothetical protein
VEECNDGHISHMLSGLFRAREFQQDHIGWIIPLNSRSHVSLPRFLLSLVTPESKTEFASLQHSFQKRIMRFAVGF